MTTSAPTHSARHEAAHAIVAIALGGRVEYLDIGREAHGESGWSTGEIPSGDSDTILAAGYAMDLLMGRSTESAWSDSSDDRERLRRQCAEETGVGLTDARLEERFREGAAQSTAILTHDGMRRAIERLAAGLQASADRGETRLTRADVLAIAGL